MTVVEALIVVAAIVCATVAAILNHLTAELGLLLGTAMGYGIKGVVANATTTVKATVPWKGAEDEQESR